MPKRSDNAPLETTDLIERGGKKLRQMLRQKRYQEKLCEWGIFHQTGFVDRSAIELLTPSLVAALEDNSLAVKMNALQLLTEFGSEGIAPLLLRLVDGADDHLRSNASTGFKQLERCEAKLLRPFLAALANQHNAVRLNATEALFRLENVDEIPVADLLSALLSLHENVDSDVAETMAWLLARNGRNSVTELVGSLKSTSFAVRLAALKALHLMRLPADAALSDFEVWSVRNRVLKKLKRGTPDRPSRGHVSQPSLTEQIRLQRLS